MIGGLAISSIIYILANIAYFTVLTPEEVLETDAVATVRYSRCPLSDV